MVGYVNQSIFIDQFMNLVLLSPHCAIETFMNFYGIFTWILRHFKNLKNSVNRCLFISVSKVQETKVWISWSNICPRFPLRKRTAPQCTIGHLRMNLGDKSTWVHWGSRFSFTWTKPCLAAAWCVQKTPTFSKFEEKGRKNDITKDGEKTLWAGNEGWIIQRSPIEATRSTFIDFAPEKNGYFHLQNVYLESVPLFKHAFLGQNNGVQRRDSEMCPSNQCRPTPT